MRRLHAITIAPGDCWWKFKVSKRGCQLTANKATVGENYRRSSDLVNPMQACVCRSCGAGDYAEGHVAGFEDLRLGLTGFSDSGAGCGFPDLHLHIEL